MKILVKTRRELQQAGRWDIDFHLPAELISAYPRHLLKRVDEVADIAKDKRDPGEQPDTTFRYIDISAVHSAVGTIVTPQELEGREAPSRARKVVRAYDVIVSTCRPTRGAVAVVPFDLHDQVASTAFSVVRAKDGVHPLYLHYALRLPSTLEQFRKWSTGSSYPAILDSDVKKTLIPVPSLEIQEQIAMELDRATSTRNGTVNDANIVWQAAVAKVNASLQNAVRASDTPTLDTEDPVPVPDPVIYEEIQARLSALSKLTTSKGKVDDQDETALELDLLIAAE